MMEYFIPQSMTDTRINIAVVGVGGTGGEVMDALTRLDFGIKALGNNHGIHVTAYDADIVEPHNIGRQRFSQSDVGSYKSITLANRINMFYGTVWDAEPRFFDPKKEDLQQYDIIIGCVDKAAFRVELGRIAADQRKHRNPVLWMDMGNDQHSGQCILGHVIQGDNEILRLPNVFDLYPNLMDPALDKEDGSRCSLAEALIGPGGQDLYINGTLATFGMNILWHLLTKGKIDRHGMTVDVQTLKSSPLMIDPIAWEFYGFKHDIAPS